MTRRLRSITVQEIGSLVPENEPTHAGVGWPREDGREEHDPAIRELIEELPEVINEVLKHSDPDGKLKEFAEHFGLEKLTDALSEALWLMQNSL